MKDIEHTLTFLRDTANAYARAKSERVYLEQFRKSKKALLIIEAEQLGLKTVQERESYAYAHKEYGELLDGLKVAVEEEERLKLKVESARLRVEVWRTENANARVERKGYNA